MKKVCFLFIALTMIIASSIGCDNKEETVYTVGESMGHIQQVEFILDTPLPDSRESVTSYKLVCPEVTIESVESLGASLGFTGEANDVPSEGVIAMSSDGGENTLRVSYTGSILYYSKHGLFKLDADLTSYEDTAIIATDFLEEIGLWFPDVELEEVKVGGTVNTNPSHLLVQYRQYIDGIPLTGNGTSYAVRIGSGGQVVKVAVWHIELEPQETVQCIEPAEACDSLMAGEGMLFALPFNCSEVTIDNAYIGYFIEPGMESGDDIIPVYVFEGECLDSDGNYIQDFRTYIEAAK